MECASKCAKGDDACADKCFTDAGCNFDAAGDACAAIEQKCADKCEPPAPTDAQLKACSDCMAANPQAKAINDCLNNAKSDADADKCFEMQCDQTCQSTADKCESACGG
jgi:hypothetical protein